MIKFKEYINEAGLSAATLAKRANWKHFTNAYSSGEPFELVSGGEIKLVQDPAILSRLANKDAKGGYKLMGVDGKTYTLAKLKKTELYGGITGVAKYNKGEVGEGILAAALATKFQFPKKKITTKMVQDRVVDYANGVTETVNDYGDKVTLEIYLKGSAAAAFKNEILFDDLTEVYDHAVKFANGRTVTKYANFLANNSTEDHVISISDGVSGEKDTKVDNYIKIGIDGDEPELAKFLNISTKVGNSTLEQSGIKSYQGVRKVFLPLGIDIDKHGMEKSFDKTDQSWYDKTFKRVVVDLNKKFGSDKKEYAFLRNLSGAIQNWATKGEKSVALVDLGKSMKVQSFDNLRRKLDQVDLYAEYDNKSKRPVIKIMDRKSGDMFMKFRIDWRGDPGEAKALLISKEAALSRLVNKKI